MKGVGIVMVIVGIACFVLPLLKVEIWFLNEAGNLRPLMAGILVMLGAGIFFFSGGEPS
jgi:hypothetical protein